MQRRRSCNPCGLGRTACKSAAAQNLHNWLHVLAHHCYNDCGEKLSQPCNGVEHQICSKAIVLTMSGLNHLFQSLGAVTLSAASQAVLQSTCRTCRAQRLPWYVVTAIYEVVKLSSTLISDLAGRHGDMPDTARAFSGLAQAYQAPNKKFERGPPATFEQVQQLGS